MRNSHSSKVHVLTEGFDNPPHVDIFMDKQRAEEAFSFEPQ